MSEPENKVRFGLAEVAISMMEGPGVYGKVERIPGVVKITTDPDGDSEKFYADDGVYYTVVTNNGYTGEAEFALIRSSRLPMRYRSLSHCCSACEAISASATTFSTTSRQSAPSLRTRPLKTSPAPLPRRCPSP